MKSRKGRKTFCGSEVDSIFHVVVMLYSRASGWELREWENIWVSLKFQTEENLSPEINCRSSLRNKRVCGGVLSLAVNLHQANRSHYHPLLNLTPQSIQPSIRCECASVFVCFLSSSVPCACRVMTNDAFRSRKINPTEEDSRSGEVTAWISVHCTNRKLSQWRGTNILSIKPISGLRVKARYSLGHHTTTVAPRIRVSGFPRPNPHFKLSFYSPFLIYRDISFYTETDLRGDSCKCLNSSPTITGLVFLMERSGPHYFYTWRLKIKFPLQAKGVDNRFLET